MKNELTRFKIDNESNMILDEHRDEFIPILMRIIYAKMITKTGMRTGSKAGGILKRKMILRFLAGIQENEMIIFINMAFKPFKKYTLLIFVKTYFKFRNFFYPSRTNLKSIKYF